MNYIYKFFVIVFFVFDCIGASDGRTQFIEYVIAQEVEIVKIEQDIERLKHACYETVQVDLTNLKTCNMPQCQYCEWVHITQNEYGQEIHRSKPYHCAHSLSHPSIECRKSSCSDDDIKLLHKRCVDLHKMISETVNRIALMVKQGALVNACDMYGKSALDYSSKHEIRAVLLSHGAYSAFEWIQWKNDCYRHGVAFGCTACAAVLVYFYYNQV